MWMAVVHTRGVPIRIQPDSLWPVLRHNTIGAGGPARRSLDDWRLFAERRESEVALNLIPWQA